MRSSGELFFRNSDSARIQTCVLRLRGECFNFNIVELFSNFVCFLMANLIGPILLPQFLLQKASDTLVVSLKLRVGENRVNKSNGIIRTRV